MNAELVVGRDDAQDVLQRNAATTMSSSILKRARRPRGQTRHRLQADRQQTDDDQGQYEIVEAPRVLAIALHQRGGQRPKSCGFGLFRSRRPLACSSSSRACPPAL